MAFKKVSPKKRLAVFEWFDKTEAERETQSALTRRLWLTKEQLDSLKEEYLVARGIITIKPPKPAYNSEAYLEKREPEADEALMEAVKKGNATAIRTYYQLRGKLIEKAELKSVSVELTGDEYYAIRQRATETHARDGKKPSRNRKVCARPAILSNQLCVDTGQSDRAEN